MIHIFLLPHQKLLWRNELQGYLKRIMYKQGEYSQIQLLVLLIFFEIILYNLLFVHNDII